MGTPARLDTANGKAVTFNGYYRVWNEGHWKGDVAPSNPHHVLEVHPAWGFTFQGGSFENKPLVRTMASFRGFGVSKYRKVLTEADAWLKAYQNADSLFVQLQDSSNFFQLPVTIKAKQSVPGGTTLTVDVFSSNTFQNLVFANLKAVTVTGGVVGSPLTVGSKVTLLGVFSVNLRTALDGVPAGATSANSAASVKAALEFFIFGKAKQSAIASCS